VSAWRTLRELRERELICATETDEPINGCDAVDELAAIRRVLDEVLASEPDVGAAFAELDAALREHDDAQWDYAIASAPSNAPVVGPPPAPAVSQGAAGFQPRIWDLGGGVTMHVLLPATLTKKNFGRIQKYVNALQVEAAVLWDDEGDNAS